MPCSEAEATSKGQQDGPASGSCDASLPSRLPRVCAAPGCGAIHGLKRCGGCGMVRYCSEACSRAHWRAHKAECRRLQAERAAGDAAAPVHV